MISNSKNPKLELVYTDSKKRKWYGLKNPIGDLSAVRGIAGGRAERYVGLMISESELELALDEQIKAFNSGDMAKAAAIAYDLKYRRKFLVEEKSVLDLAGIYFFLEDEDINDWSDHQTLKKQAIWQEDEKCRGFFLRMGFGLTKKFQNMSEGDLLKFMGEMTVVAERIYRHIPTPIQRLNNSKIT
jgi:hypothetical protein